MNPSTKLTNSADAYELRFTFLFDEGRALAFLSLGFFEGQQ